MLHPAVSVSRTLLWGSLATLAFATAAGTAGAAPASDTAMIRKEVTVRLTDLDLSKPTDAAKFYRRIRRAANQACDSGWTIDRDCVATAVANAVTSINRPLVTALHQQNARSAS